MKRDEFAMKIKEVAMSLIYDIMDEIKGSVSSEGILWETVDDLEGEYVRWIDEMSTKELIDRRHEIHNVSNQLVVVFYMSVKNFLATNTTPVLVQLQLFATVSTCHVILLLLLPSYQIWHYS